MEFVKRVIIACKQIEMAVLCVDERECLVPHLVRERESNEYGYVCLTHVKGWPVKNNVITNRKRNKKRRWSREKPTTTRTISLLDAECRMTENCEIDTSRSGRREQANDQMDNGGRMQEHENGYQYQCSNIIICCSFSVVRFWYRNQFNAYFLLLGDRNRAKKNSNDVASTDIPNWEANQPNERINERNAHERRQRGCKNKQYLLIPTIVKLLQSFVFFPKTTIKRFLWLLQRVDLFFWLSLYLSFIYPGHHYHWTLLGTSGGREEERESEKTVHLCLTF